MDFIFPENMAFPIHKNFRLWMSTIPVPEFPKDFARRCRLVSRELPKSIRPSTQKSLGLISDDYFEKLTSHQATFKKLTFSLTVMHAVIN